MFQSTTLTRLTRQLLVAAALSAVIVPAAGAFTRPPDVQDAANANLAAQLSPPDVRDAALSTSLAVPDVLERYVTSHPYGSNTAATGAGPSPVERSIAQERARRGDPALFGPGSSTAVPDVIERYATAHPYGSGLSSQEVSVPRPPDVTDAALAAQDSSFGGSNSSFNWDDWAIGIGSGIGMALLLGGAVVTSRQIRQRPRTA